VLNFDEYGLRPLDCDDLEFVLAWRNSERIRANMYTDHIISASEHQAWYDRIKDEPSVVYRLFEYRQTSVGLSYFTDIDLTNGLCLWGFYLGAVNLPGGSGTMMGYLSLQHAFDQLHIRKVCGEVLTYNEPSLKFFRRLGFVEEGRRRQHVLRKGGYVDVVIFSLLDDEWRRAECPRVKSMLQATEEVQS